MQVRNLPIVFLSFDEANADANYADLQGYNFDKVTRVHGVHGFDAAHKAASAAALALDPNSQWFVTVDADNVIQIGSPVWSRDVLDEFAPYTTMAAHRSVLSYRAVNGVNAACYGNGGIKIWSHEFINNMKTHEASEDNQVVDFCWLPCYFQSSKIASTTWPNGSPEQAFRSGYREGVKIIAVTKFAHSDAKRAQAHFYIANRAMLYHWTLLGNDVANGAWCILGAMKGAVDAAVSPDQTLDNLVDHLKVIQIFREYSKNLHVLSDVEWPQTDVSYQGHVDVLLSELWTKRGLIKSSPLGASRSASIKTMFDFERNLVHPRSV